ncbi:MAG: hypothetical protein ACTH7W_08300 [Psychrobacter sp.]|uniref:hypothetical protein n=1 Tax=unclassified Psychrobacter TaxID=196806 RepID=UPI003F98714E
MAVSSHLPTSTSTTGTGQCTAIITISRMQPFTVHFRRPDIKPLSANEIKGSIDYYDGSYGFDWLRDEYIYDIEEVYELGKDSSTNNTTLMRLYKGKVEDLINEYSRFSSSDKKIAEIESIETVLKETYVPAWLSIFPTSYSSDENSTGVDLYLQVEQEQLLGVAICPLQSPESIAISFDAGNDSGISITAPGISTLADLLGGSETELKRHFDGPELQNKVIRRYRDNSKKINITATTGSDKVRVIKIIATTKKITKTVGLLCVYPNDTIKQADIKAVPYIIFKNGKESPMPNPIDIQQYVNRYFLNQSLVQGTVSREPSLDITNSEQFTRPMLDNLNKNMKTYIQVNPATNTYYIDSRHAKSFSDTMVALYEDARKLKLNDDGDNQKTYVFFTDFPVYKPLSGNFSYAVYGAAENTEQTLCSSCSAKKTVWGNTVVMFASGNTRLGKISHELGHSFSLPHTFDNGQSTPHAFYQGYTDNVMDYPNKINTEIKNPYEDSLLSLFKWQWNLIRQDRSIK